MNEVINIFFPSVGDNGIQVIILAYHKDYLLCIENTNEINLKKWLSELKLVKSKIISEKDATTSLPLFNLCTQLCSNHENDSYDCPYTPKIKLPRAFIKSSFWSGNTKVSMYSAILNTNQNQYKQILDEIHKYIEKMVIEKKEKCLDTGWTAYFINCINELRFGINLQFENQPCKNTGKTIPDGDNACIEFSMHLRRPHTNGHHVLKFYFQDAIL